MALYLLHRVTSADRNPSGLNACLVDAADEAAARALAAESVPDGATKVRDTWACVSIASSAALPKNPIWFEGDAVSLLGFRRGSRI